MVTNCKVIRVVIDWELDRKSNFQTSVACFPKYYVLPSPRSVTSLENIPDTLATNQTMQN